MTNYKIAVYAICKNEVQFVDRWMDSMQEADLVVVRNDAFGGGGRGMGDSANTFDAATMTPPPATLRRRMKRGSWMRLPAVPERKLNRPTFMAESRQM